MKNLSVKTKVTLWYSVLMILIVCVTLAFMLLVSEYVFESQTQMTLVKTVENNVDEIEYEFGIMDIEDDFYFVDDGVYSLVFDRQFNLVDGQYPDGFQTDEPFISEKTRKIECNSKQYYLYDRLLTAQEYGYDDDVWVRGVVPVDRSDSFVMLIVRLSYILLPLLVIFAVTTGSVIAKKSFEPVRRITDTVNNISANGDLKQRVEISGKNDEITTLARTFDDMLDKLEQSFEAEKQFTSDASHELRTPVSVILAECELALDGEQPTQEYIESLEVIQRQTKKMSQLISQLLSFTRLEQGVYKPELSLSDLSETVLAVCEDQKIVNEGNIRLCLDIEEGVTANIDISLVSRLVENLVSNAYRYNKPDGSVFVSLHKEGTKAILKVRDTGIGIASNDLDKIWQRFYRSDVSRSTQGTGLGLSMVKQIARLHSATVNVESVQGEGTCFTVSFG